LVGPREVQRREVSAVLLFSRCAWAWVEAQPSITWAGPCWLSTKLNNHRTQPKAPSAGLVRCSLPPDRRFAPTPSLPTNVSVTSGRVREDTDYLASGFHSHVSSDQRTAQRSERNWDDARKKPKQQVKSRRSTEVASSHRLDTIPTPPPTCARGCLCLLHSPGNLVRFLEEA
jgi:hypothetical protein